MRSYSLKEARQIGDALRVPWRKVSLSEFRKGLAVEMEHGSHDPETDVIGDDVLKAGKIAWAHLKELPDYYTRLARMESEAPVPAPARARRRRAS